ncbi:MAG: FkbM family methyltransferase [Schleiferiaceae bacterium]|nr:FkbM family methyltransferase [Schleiferiaceae bacterium]
MKQLLKGIQRFLNAILAPMGLELVKVYPNERGVSVYADVRFYLSKTATKLCVDVGANVGQTTEVLLSTFPGTAVVAIEPDTDSFEKLKTAYQSDDRVTCLQAFIGAQKGSTTYYRNAHSDMNSGLKSGKEAWGKVVDEVTIDVHTLDALAVEQKLQHINFLKVDTQGYDFEVLKGATGLLKRQAIDLVAIEHIFSDMYEKLPQLDEVLLYMRQHNYQMISIYTPVYQNNRVGWTDILFASNSFFQSNFQ